MRRAIASILLLTAAQPATAGETVVYTYDALGRIVAVRRVDGPARVVVATYSLDAAGNRTRVVVSGVAQGSANSGEEGDIAAPNGSFETPDVGGGFQYGPSAAGMTFSGATGVAANGSAWNFPVTPDGKQVGFLQAGRVSTITATATNLKPGVRYTIKFMAVRRPGYPANPIDVVVDGNSIGAITPGDQFADYSIGPFVAQGNSASLSLSARYQDYDTASGIDLLRVALQPTVFNASFETPVQGSGYQYSPAADGLMFENGAGLSGNGSAWGFAAAPDGNQVAFLQSGANGGGRITQHVVGLKAGATYVVRFRCAHRPGFGQAPVSLSIGGRTLTTVRPSDEFDAYTSAPFTASAASVDLTFSVAAASTDSGSAIDFTEVLPAS